MEGAFGHNFKNVKVHTDSRATGLSRSMHAKAFTISNHIAFGAGEYQPGTITGDDLIAHELAHVVQQSGATSSNTKGLSVGPSDSIAERQASNAAAVISRNARATISSGSSPVQIQRVPFTGEQDPIHQPIIDDFRRRSGLPPSGRDQFGRRVGPSAGQIKYQLSAPNLPVRRFGSLTPWQLAQQQQSAFVPIDPNPPDWLLSSYADYARASQLARLVFVSSQITYDVDAGSRILGRQPNTRELAVLNRNLSSILNLRGVRSALGQRGARAVPGSSGNPSLQGRVRIAQNTVEFGIKRYQLEMLVLGLGGQNQSQLDQAVQGLWQQFNISPGSTYSITNQEQRIAALVTLIGARGNPGFYHPGDDIIYLEPGTNLRSAMGSEVARHETVHLLGGRDQTRLAFVAHFGQDRYLPYWSTFEEGIAELLSRESRPPGQAAPAPTTTTNRSGSTTVIATSVAAYQEEVRIMRGIMNNPRVGRQRLLRAYFTGNIPRNIFGLLSRAIRNP